MMDKRCLISCFLAVTISSISCFASPLTERNSRYESGDGSNNNLLSSGYSAFPNFAAAGGGAKAYFLDQQQKDQPDARIGLGAYGGAGNAGYAAGPNGYGGGGSFGAAAGGRVESLPYGLSQPAASQPVARQGYGVGGGGYGGGGGGYGGGGGDVGGYGPYTNVQPGYFLGPHYYGGFLNQGIPRPPIGLYKNGRPLGDYAPDIFPNVTANGGASKGSYGAYGSGSGYGGSAGGGSAYGGGGYGGGGANGAGNVYGGGGGAGYGGRSNVYGSGAYGASGGGGGYGLAGRAAELPTPAENPAIALAEKADRLTVDNPQQQELQSGMISVSLPQQSASLITF